MTNTMPTLTPAEENIILHKGTEAPFTGEYRDSKGTGTYICRQCGMPLYRSTDKFDSGCGRPSLDGALPWAVTRTDDAYGMRTEITCTHCGWHLGHVFIGEQLTDKNTRHCVNSLSMKFIPEWQPLPAGVVAQATEPTYEKATFGGGCFRCIEAWIQWLRGVIQVDSWYSGGKREFPTYEHICTGCTGHIEVIQVTFDPAIISYEILLQVFFTLHDPCSMDKQGGDSGEQYRSVIFTHNDAQADIAHALIDRLTAEKVYDAPIVTEVRPLDKFRIAEGYHQNYYNQHASKPYCQLVINPKLVKLRSERKEYLKD